MVSNSKKYKDILVTAKKLFWKHGFKRVSVEEICLNANVSKMTFYKYFPNKTELAKTIYDNVIIEGQKQFRQILTDDTPTSEKIRKFIQMKAEGTNDISMEFLQDFYVDPESELKAYVEEKTRQTWDVLIIDFKEAQKNGVFRSDFKPEFLIKVQFKLMEMLEDESMISMYDTQQELILEFANLMMFGIVPHE
jgi:AcrR family transcriptional regulator